MSDIQYNSVITISQFDAILFSQIRWQLWMQHRTKLQRQPLQYQKHLHWLVKKWNLEIWNCQFDLWPVLSASLYSHTNCQRQWVRLLWKWPWLKKKKKKNSHAWFPEHSVMPQMAGWTRPLRTGTNRWAQESKQELLLLPGQTIIQDFVEWHLTQKISNEHGVNLLNWL